MIDWKVIVVVALAVELFNLALRFGAHLTSACTHVEIMRKCRIKILPHFHHVYLGLIIALVSYLLSNPLFVSVGLGISISDVLHHFILKIVNGDSEFNILYKLEKASGLRRARIRKYEKR